MESFIRSSHHDTALAKKTSGTERPSATPQASGKETKRVLLTHKVALGANIDNITTYCFIVIVN